MWSSGRLEMHVYPLPIGPSLLLLPVSVLRELQVVENFCDHAKFTLEVDRGKTENTLYTVMEFVRGFFIIQNDSFSFPPSPLGPHIGGII